MDWVDNLTKMIVTEEYGICFVVGGECANSDVIGWTGGGETEELTRLGGGKNENVTPRVVVRVSRNICHMKCYNYSEMKICVRFSNLKDFFNFRLIFFSVFLQTSNNPGTFTVSFFSILCLTFQENRLFHVKESLKCHFY